jgi:hypothetical protein
MSSKMNFFHFSKEWIGGWVGPRIGMDAVEKRKILHCRE